MAFYEELIGWNIYYFSAIFTTTTTSTSISIYIKYNIYHDCVSLLPHHSLFLLFISFVFTVLALLAFWLCFAFHHIWWYLNAHFNHHQPGFGAQLIYPNNVEMMSGFLSVWVNWFHSDFFYVLGVGSFHAIFSFFFMFYSGFCYCCACKLLYRK